MTRIRPTRSKNEAASNIISKLLLAALLVFVVIFYLAFKFREAAPPPDCSFGKSYDYSGDVMWDFGIKNSVFFRDNPSQAACWFQKSAEAGYHNAFGSIGRAYENGDGVSQDFKKAIFWYEKGIAAGDSGGFYLLGKLYLNGKGVRQDKAKARELFEKAAALGNGGAKSELKKLNSE